jgi:hypothetical protein
MELVISHITIQTSQISLSYMESRQTTVSSFVPLRQESGRTWESAWQATGALVGGGDTTQCLIYNIHDVSGDFCISHVSSGYRALSS